MTQTPTINKVNITTKTDMKGNEPRDRPQNKKEKMIKASGDAIVIVKHTIEARISMARTILSNNLNKHISIPQLARQTGIKEVMLREGFKQLYGQSILDYQKQLRLEKAQQLLSTTNMPVADITYHVGYRNVSHFTALFKRHMGLTPTEWRKKHE